MRGSGIEDLNHTQICDPYKDSGVKRWKLTSSSQRYEVITKKRERKKEDLTLIVNVRWYYKRWNTNRKLN